MATRLLTQTALRYPLGALELGIRRITTSVESAGVDNQWKNERVDCNVLEPIRSTRDDGVWLPQDGVGDEIATT